MNCPICYQAETTWLDRLRDKRRSTVYQSASAMMSSTLSAVMGAPAQSWYERHREDFVRTGDEVHLKRMLRHVVDSGKL